VTTRRPITAAVQRVLLVACAGETVAIPIARVERILEVPAALLEVSGGETFALVVGLPLPVLDLAARLARGPAPRASVATLVLTDVRGERVALRVERVTGQQQIYVKPVPELLGHIRALAGLTILGDGRPVFVLDPNQLA
jgi:two-component system chemotaxis sensor kinase CheA